MQTGAITSYIDVAQLTLYAFWIFFAGLILYLRREDKREGYPLVGENPGDEPTQGFPTLPKPKVFLLHDGSTVLAPRVEAPETVAARRLESWAGAPYVPTGNPLIDGVGPAAYANRPDVPDVAFDDHLPKIVPLRASADFFLAFEDSDPRGFAVLGADGVQAGVISDVWVDRSEIIIRYLEVTLTDGAHVLLPMNITELKPKLGQIRVSFITGAQFADVPKLKNPDTVTFLEEDKIMGYYGGGLLYALPGRTDPVL